LYIAPSEFVSILKHTVLPVIESSKYIKRFGNASFFEICLCIALVYFARKKCTYVILEAGIGGRYDATNFVKHPLITAITNVGYDHTEILGSTLAKIAQDKAGIIKSGSCFYTSESREAICAIFKKQCAKHRVKYANIPLHTSVIKRNQALVGVILQNLKISKQIINQVLFDTKLPCRFEQVCNIPRVILDGAHNPAKVAYVVKMMRENNIKNSIVVFAAAKDKNVSEMLKKLLSIASTIICTEINTVGVKKFFSCMEFKKIVSKNFTKKKEKTVFFYEPDVHKSFTRAKKMAGREGVILITGSFYLVGEIRKQFYPENYILKNRGSF